MRLPRVRFTVRRVMISVVIVALACEVELWRRRYPHCRDSAARCASEEKSHLYLAGSHRRISALYRKLAADGAGSLRFNREQAALFARAALKERAQARVAADRGEAFRRAARYPWVTIPPAETDPMGVGFVDRIERSDTDGKEPDRIVRPRASRGPSLMARDDPPACGP
jgi:hypothetical protein